jgi:hypothetical protein
LAEEIQGDVGKSDVFLESGRVSAPLGQPVPKHEGVVTEHEGVRGDRSRAGTS